MIPELAIPKTPSDLELFPLHPLMLSDATFFAQPFLQTLLKEFATYYPFEEDHYGLVVPLESNENISIRFRPGKLYELQLNPSSNIAVANSQTEKTLVSRSFTTVSQLRKENKEALIQAGYYFPVTPDGSLLSFFRPYTHNLDIASPESIEVTYTFTTLLNNLAVQELNQTQK